MRCSTAAILALAMHPRYRQRDGVMEESGKMARDHFKGSLDCTFILNMPVEIGKAILEPEITRLVKTQRPSGMWKIKDCRRISYDLLKALKYSGHLTPLLREDRFRHDPFRSFRDDSDCYGFVVRQRLTGSLRSPDGESRSDDLGERR